MLKKEVETKKITPHATAKKEVKAAPVRNEPAVSLLGFTPFGLMRRFTENLERMFEDFNHFRLIPFFEKEFALPHWTEPQIPMWLPQIEILEKDGQVTVRADLPGMKKEDIDIELTDDTLVISGERRHESREKRDDYFRTERSYGNFYRSIPLPKGADAEHAKAVFEHGVLEVTMQVPAKERKGRKLKINEPVEKAKAAAG